MAECCLLIEWSLVRREDEPCQLPCAVSMSKKPHSHCLLLVSPKNGFESDSLLSLCDNKTNVHFMSTIIDSGSIYIFSSLTVINILCCCNSG